MAATIHDVAKKAGVSVGSVSRYLNGHTLKEKNRLAVEQAIIALDFKENLIAKGLKNFKTMTVGVLIGSLTDIFSTSVVTALEQVLEQENYSLIVCDYEGQRSKFKQKIRFLKERYVDGLVVFPGSGRDDLIKEAVDEKTPMVIINDDIEGVVADKVVVDNVNASDRAVETLIRLKHRKIAIIGGPPESYAGSGRLKGYLEALERNKLSVNPEYVTCGDFSSKGGYDRTVELLSLPEPPTAIYVCNYYMTLGALMAVNKLGVRIPEELSVIGFDRFEFMDAVNPALTVIEQPMAGIGREAAKILLRRMKRDYGNFPEKQVLKARMIQGDSTRELDD